MKSFNSLLIIPIISTSFTSNIFSMDFESKKNIAFKGKIATVKTSKKFRSVESCQSLCSSRTSCVAFTLDISKGSCTVFKNITQEIDNNSAVSGIKN